MSVTVETDGGRPQLSQLRRSTTGLPSGREILDPRTLPRGAEAARSFLQELRERIPADSHIFSHLIAVFDVWITGSIVNSSFITALATSLESYPELLESFQTASSQMAPPVKLHIAVDTRGKISLVTIISSGKDGLIVPISTDMRRLADEFSSNMTPITSSSGLRSLLGIPDRCREVLMKMDVRWMAAVIPLIQLELTENNAYSRQLHMLLLKLTKTNCSLPASLLLENIEREGANPISGGGFAVGFSDYVSSTGFASSRLGYMAWSFTWPSRMSEGIALLYGK
ncbi:hypothetical protein K435DRAFT_30716 [Dendrothele bispora CBS 962.96]|uniref:Uncharacterized protein n=1 Tax=Dendrothele bispora (strain CBS 962.96) TaxID=1314807 RepID=A0A4S8M7W1_DENBC|nr:hypothetical protein K435DRAFT_30716 [Dendrothele bispora CBS 962.96]